MNKDTELARMEHKINTQWANIEMLLLKDEEAYNEAWQSIQMMMNLTRPLPGQFMAASVLFGYAAQKFVMEARRKGLIPKQNGV